MEDDEELLGLPAARREFLNLSEVEVRQAIDEKRKSNAAEVIRLAIDYEASLKTHFKHHGHAPPGILRIKARCPIEKIAALMVVNVFEAEVGTACLITFY